MLNVKDLPEYTSGLVRARGLKLKAVFLWKTWIVRARKSPWIETCEPQQIGSVRIVRARKSPWIETSNLNGAENRRSQGS